MPKRTPRQLRNEHGLKVEDVAAYLGLHKSNYSRKERGIIRFSIHEAISLARLYQVPVEEIDFSVHVVAANATTEGV